MDKGPTMTKTITATEARVHMGEVLRCVNETKEPYIVEKSGTPVAVVISYEEYERLVPPACKTDPWEQVLAAQRVFAPYREQLEDIDWSELIRAGREERDEELVRSLTTMSRRESDLPPGDE